MFTTFEVTSVKGVTIHSGKLRLSQAQATAREHALLPLGGNDYQVAKAVFFKRGEVIGYDGSLPKALTSSMDSLGDENAETQIGQVKASADAKAAGGKKAGGKKAVA